MIRPLLKSLTEAIPGMTPARLGSLAVVGLAALLILLGVAWRLQTPRAPLFPLAQHALELHAEWRDGRRPLNHAAAPAGLPDFARWSVEGGVDLPLRVAAPMPSVPLPWAGAGTVSLETAPALLSAWGTNADGALAVVVGAEHAAVLGDVAGHLENEWTRYDYDAGDRRLLVWRRGPCLFALVTVRSLVEAAQWVPGPTTRPARTDAAGRPGSSDPSATQ